jgi:hypothetical protein
VEIDLDQLPDDPVLLQQMLRDVVSTAAYQHRELHAENDKLRMLIKRLLRHRFGRRSEQLGADQLQFGLEDLEQTVAANQAGQEAADIAAGGQRRRGDARPNRNHGALPAHLPRYEVVIDIEDRACPCCGRSLRVMGELRTEQLDIAPAQLRVRVTRRPRYVCNSCDDVPVVVPATKLFADDTTLPVLDPGRGRTKKGRLWCYAVDDRPWRGESHPVAAYVYSEDHRVAHPAEHLASFKGVLQVDGYNGFKRLAGDRADASVCLAFCWAHMRRGFYDFHVSTKSPLAAEVLARIRALYAIEAEIRGHPAEHRRRVRQERSRPIVEALHAWMEHHLPRVSGASDLALAIRYALRHWSGLIVFLEDGRVEMDNNVVERAIRPIPMTRKVALFAGSDGGARHWAIAMTLIQTAKLNGVEPMAWLTDVLERIVSGRTKARELQNLLPWNWRDPSSSDAALAA